MKRSIENLELLDAMADAWREDLKIEKFEEQTPSILGEIGPMQLRAELQTDGRPE